MPQRHVLAKSFYTTQITDNLPLGLCYWLHRETCAFDQRHRLQPRLHLASIQRDRAQQRLHRTQANAIPARIVGRAVRGGFADHLDDADDLFADVRMVKEPQIADFHRPHIVARLIVPHAMPFLTRIPTGDLIGPAPGVRFGFEQPTHQPMTFFHSLMVTDSNSPALALGSASAQACAWARVSTVRTTRLPVICPSPRTGPAISTTPEASICARCAARLSRRVCRWSGLSLQIRATRMVYSCFKGRDSRAEIACGKVMVWSISAAIIAVIGMSISSLSAMLETALAVAAPSTVTVGSKPCPAPMACP